MLDLILIPGLLCDQAVWTHQAQTLQANIIIPDHGSLDSIPAMADAILEKAPPRFVLIGHSMGGRIAFQLFRKARERVIGIGLFDTAAGPRREDEEAGRYKLLEMARSQGMRAMGEMWVQQMVHPERLSDNALIDAILDMIERKTPDIFAAQIQALLTRPDATSVLPEIQCPALVLCGRQDTWSVLGEHEKMAAVIPHSRLVVIEDCGHMSPMERPSDVTAAMRDWLTSL
jgi:pimeloyl-ACP methyl ester carboxylesterase